MSKTTTDNTTPTNVGSTSALYEQIVEDFLGRLEADEAVSAKVVENLRCLLAEGSPKAAQLTAAFVDDEDIT